MKILIIGTPGEGGGKQRVRFGASLRTAETATARSLENAKLLGHKVLKRSEVSDKLVDQTYTTTGAARIAAKAAGFETLTTQKLAAEADKK